MFWLEKEFQLSNTNQCNVFQTQNFIFLFRIGEHKNNAISYIYAFGK